MNLPRFHIQKGWQRLPARLDQQPTWRVITLGVVASLTLGLPGFFYLRSPLWVMGWLLVFGALGWLGWRAEPVFWEAIPEPAKPRATPRRGPHRVRDGSLVWAV